MTGVVVSDVQSKMSRLKKLAGEKAQEQSIWIGHDLGDNDTTLEQQTVNFGLERVENTLSCIQSRALQYLHCTLAPR